MHYNGMMVWHMQACRHCQAGRRRFEPAGRPAVPAN